MPADFEIDQGRARKPAMPSEVSGHPAEMPALILEHEQQEFFNQADGHDGLATGESNVEVDRRRARMRCFPFRAKTHWHFRRHGHKVRWWGGGKAAGGDT